MLKILQWQALSAEERRAALRRPAQQEQAQTYATVQSIIDRVRREGDAGLNALTRQFDGVEFGRVSKQELEEAQSALKPEQKQALDRAIANVKRFHELQALAPLRVETSPG